MTRYAYNWSLYLRGFRWLWTRELWLDERPDWPVWRWRRDNDLGEADESVHPDAADADGIWYKRGWTPAKFLLPYCTTILLSVALGFGVVPFSTVIWQRWPQSWLRKLIDRVLGENHCRDAGSRLWGSRSVW